MAGSLRKKAELARIAGLPDTTLLIEPAVVVVGHEWYFYLVYLQSKGAVHVLEHGSCSTSSVSGVFKLLRVLRTVIEYGIEGVEEGEGTVGFWGGFLGPVLERLAGGDAGGDVARGRTKSQAHVATPDEGIWIGSGGSTAVSNVTI